MYGSRVLFLGFLVLPISAVPLTGSTILQKNAVVERNDDLVGATILPSLPKREPIIDLVGRARRIGGGGFTPPKRSVEEVEKRKHLNGGGSGLPKRRSDSLETRGILRPIGAWEEPGSIDSLKTRGGRRGGGGGGKWVGRRSENLETREEADEDKDPVDEVEVDASEEISNDLEERGITKHSGNGRRGFQGGGVGGNKSGLRGTGGADGHKRGLQRPNKGGGGKRGLTPGRGGSK
ncbi:hypothetical protein J4E86_006189 [Alternaria arbusti]|uniref:uncharacterized protein n=1 Tax=Alternaria arbusti TaxID=232088 RepID=UPI00221F9506|nr:uncharacterized protein J4E86_006189 [Alternaria arbusti]KAI4954879.1 hypothetical protein J4E86_006189 [Alternaria arbusti]